jgi:hypothetical protein
MLAGKTFFASPVSTDLDASTIIMDTTSTDLDALTALMDREAVRNVLAAYSYYVDEGAYEAFLDQCFWSDATRWLRSCREAR